MLVAEGIAVVPVMTDSATRFLGPLTLSGICGTPVVRDMFDAGYGGEVHVDLGRSLDLVLVVPATADLLARLAQGRADDIVSALSLSVACPVLVAPAMHTRMWRHPATQRNVATLRSDGRVTLIGPVEGPLASGETGPGRLSDPEEIVAAAASARSGATRRRSRRAAPGGHGGPDGRRHRSGAIREQPIERSNGFRGGRARSEPRRAGDADRRARRAVDPGRGHPRGRAQHADMQAALARRSGRAWPAPMPW